MRCPREGATLVASPFMGLEIDACPVCDGTFLRPGQLARLHGREADLPHEMDLETRDPRGEIACPQCGAGMATRWSSPSQATRVDLCPTCGGLWLDTSELRQVLDEAEGGP